MRIYALFVVLALAAAGCSSRGVADSAASIWEAAGAIEKGADVGTCVAIIKVQSKAIIVASGCTYRPAGVTDE